MDRRRQSGDEDYISEGAEHPTHLDDVEGVPREEALPDTEQTLELREERLAARKELEEVGEVKVHKRVEEAPGRMEVEAYHEEIDIQHVPIGQFVSEKMAPWDEGDTTVIPIYEEQLVVSKRLVLKEQVRVRRVRATERRLVQDTLRQERLVVDDTTGSAVRERYATDEGSDAEREPETDREKGGFLHKALRKTLE